MPIDSNVPRNEIWFMPQEILEEFRSTMDRANNPPEHLPSEESKWMATNDYGYAAKDENVMAEPMPSDNPNAVMNKLAKQTNSGYEEFTAAAQALNEVTSSYENVSRALEDAKERYQRAFFRMNENLGEVNEWLNSRQRSQSDDS